MNKTLTTQQQDMVDALDSLQNAMRDLRAAWEHYNIDTECDNTEYPFDRDFNEFTDVVCEWAHDITEQIYTPVVEMTREQLKEQIVKSFVTDCSNDKDYLEHVIYDGFKGINDYTDEHLIEEYLSSVQPGVKVVITDNIVVAETGYIEELKELLVNMDTALENRGDSIPEIIITVTANNKPCQITVGADVYDAVYDMVQNEIRDLSK